MTASFSSARMLGEFSAVDGSVESYGRVNAFLKPHFVMVAKVIGLDVDEAVLSNQSTDVNLVMKGGRLPLEDRSADDRRGPPLWFNREALRAAVISRFGRPVFREAVRRML